MCLGAVAVLLMVAPLVHSALPYVRSIPIQKQRWQEYNDATRWGCGLSDIHDGFDPSQKRNKFKIADFFINLSGLEGQANAVLCEAEVQGTPIEAYWLNKASIQNYNGLVNSFVFGFQIGQSKIKFGIRGSRSGWAGIRTRVQLYGGSPASGVTISCGAGHDGQIDDPSKLYLDPRMQNDVA